MFKGILITKDESGYQAAVQQIDDAVLPEGDVTVRVEWSTLNYKDGLALTGKSPVVQRFPMVPGIDFAGTVSESSNPDWKAGDRVVLNGWGVGETHCGGLAELARVRGEWLVPLPAAFRHVRRWRSARPATPPCSACWRWKGTASSRPTAKFWSPVANGGVGGRGHRAAVESRLLGGGVDRLFRRSRTPEERCNGGHRTQRTLRAGQAARQGELGRRRRHAGQPDAGRTPARRPRPSRRRGRLRAGRRHGFPGDGGAVHPARRDAVRHRQRHGAAGGASGSPWARLAGDLDIAKLDAITTEIGLSEAATGARLLEGSRGAGGSSSISAAERRAIRRRPEFGRFTASTPGASRAR